MRCRSNSIGNCSCQPDTDVLQVVILRVASAVVLFLFPAVCLLLVPLCVTKAFSVRVDVVPIKADAACRVAFIQHRVSRTRLRRQADRNNSEHRDIELLVRLNETEKSAQKWQDM